MQFLTSIARKSFITWKMFKNTEIVFWTSVFFIHWYVAETCGRRQTLRDGTSKHSLSLFLSLTHWTGSRCRCYTWRCYMAATRIKACRSSSAAKALGDGQAGMLAGPWYMAAGCSPKITDTQLSSRDGERNVVIKRSLAGYVSCNTLSRDKHK